MVCWAAREFAMNAVTAAATSVPSLPLSTTTATTRLLRAIFLPWVMLLFLSSSLFSNASPCIKSNQMHDVSPLLFLENASRRESIKQWVVKIQSDDIIITPRTVISDLYGNVKGS